MYGDGLQVFAKYIRGSTLMAKRSFRQVERLEYHRQYYWENKEAILKKRREDQERKLQRAAYMREYRKKMTQDKDSVRSLKIEEWQRILLHTEAGEKVFLEQLDIHAT